MRTLLVANRGEIACRVIRAAKSLGLRTVAVYSDADASALHTALADTAIAIGGAKPADSYLRIPAILAAALRAGADAIHPGYGFLAENDDFASAVQAAGLLWVGPDPKSMVDMGDKERARLLAKAAGVPVLPGSARFAPGDLDGLEEAAEDVGYPLLVKASAGGGGIGMRLVEGAADLRKTVETTQGLAARSFGDGTVFLERYVRHARHVEMQVFGFGDGHAVHCFERECSIQRRFQKLVEESPSPGLSPDARAAMSRAAVALARQERYRGAGTVEFVLDDDTGAFYFLEMNTRIQVEHPVTEMLTGLDLVGMQIRLAMGEHIGAASGRCSRGGSRDRGTNLCREPGEDVPSLPRAHHATGIAHDGRWRARRHRRARGRYGDAVLRFHAGETDRPRPGPRRGDRKNAGGIGRDRCRRHHDKYCVPAPGGRP